MTEKQEKILQSALELFAKEGYKATSTSKVAKHAGVSEGLIFRHYKNKDGLLEAIMKEGEERVKVLFGKIVFETDPKTVIRNTLDAFSQKALNQDEIEFWKLQYKIKWELEIYAEHKMEPLFLALSNAFTKLGYDEPELEAQLLLIMIDGLATRSFLQETFDLDSMIGFLKRKYGV